MEPSLKHGDILLIRKADFPVLRRFGIGSSSGPDKSTMAQDILDVGSKHSNNGGNDDDDDENVEDRISNLIMRNRRLREYEYQDHIARESASVWFRSPPWPIKGQIVTYRSPYQYPTELCIKRVVGVAGQIVSRECIRQSIAFFPAVAWLAHRFLATPTHSSLAFTKHYLCYIIIG